MRRLLTPPVLAVTDHALPSTLDNGWSLSPSVALRPEPFGALAYHFGNRRLTFLKHPLLVEVVNCLSEHPTARDALVAVGVPAHDYPAYQRALAGLVAADMLVARQPELAPNGAAR